MQPPVSQPSEAKTASGRQGSATVVKLSPVKFAPMNSLRKSLKPLGNGTTISSNCRQSASQTPGITKSANFKSTALYKVISSVTLSLKTSTIITAN